MRKDDKRRIAHEILIFMGLMALLFLVLRLWPVVLLFVLGIFAAALRMLFLSTKKVEIIEPAKPESSEPAAPETEHDLLNHAYALVQRRISDEVNADYPGARWVWENPNARKSMTEGEPLAILLSGAGGYKRARVCLVNLQYQGLAFDGAGSAGAEAGSAGTASDENVYLQSKTSEEASEKPEESKINYECLAFEWLEDYLILLNTRCNEAAGQKETHLLIPVDDLPLRESWADITKLLLSNGFDVAMETDEGIKVNLPQ